MASSAVSKLKQLLLPMIRHSEHSGESAQSHTASQEAFDAALADFQRTPPPRPLRVDMGEDFNEKNISFEGTDYSEEMETSSGGLGCSKVAAGAARYRRPVVVPVRKDSLLLHPVGSNHGDDQHRIAYYGRPLSEDSLGRVNSRKSSSHTLTKHVSNPGTPVPQAIPATATKNPTIKRSSAPLPRSDQTKPLLGTGSAPNGGISTGQEFCELSKQFTPEAARGEGTNCFRTDEPTTPPKSEWPPKIFRKALGEKSVGQVSNTMARKQIVDEMDGKQPTEMGEPAKGHKKGSYSFFPSTTKLSNLPRRPTLPLDSPTPASRGDFDGMLDAPPPAGAIKVPQHPLRSGTWTTDHQARMEGGIARRAAAERQRYHKLMAKMTEEYERSLLEPKRSLNPFKLLSRRRDDDE